MYIPTIKNASVLSFFVVIVREKNDKRETSYENSHLSKAERKAEEKWKK